MANKLESLRWKPRWVSHLGCIKGCLEYLNLEVSDAWLFGATGHAFVINVHEAVCPSGPTAWHTEAMGKLGSNAGYLLDVVFAVRDSDDFAEKQKAAWERTRQAIDEGLPCYGWELDIPEFYVIYGYDDVGYHYRGPGCDDGKGPKPWQELGDTEIGCLEVFVVKPGQASDDAKTVKDTLGFALEHAKSPEKWTFPKYCAGLPGYDTWIRALESGTAEGFGMAYNAAVWSECRGFAVGFLQEARDRIGGDLSELFDEALAHYQVVAESLKAVADTYPFHELEPAHIKDEIRRSKALGALREARRAEEAGLAVLERIVARL